jgi:hypothetical protein
LSVVLLPQRAIVVGTIGLISARFVLADDDLPAVRFEPPHISEPSAATPVNGTPN